MGLDDFTPTANGFSKAELESDECPQPEEPDHLDNAICYEVENTFEDSEELSMAEMRDADTGELIIKSDMFAYQQGLV